MKLAKLILINCTVLIFTVSNAQTGLVAHWSFDSIYDGQFIDHVTNQTGGTVYGCQSVSGPVGNALSFDGTHNYVRIPGNGQPPPPVLASLSEGSISLWFNVEDIPVAFGIRPIFYYGRNNACNFFDAANEGLIIEVGHSPIHYSSRRLYYTMWTNGCTYPSFCFDSWYPIHEGQWYHYVVVVGSNFNAGYLNGQLMDDRRYNFGNSSTHEFFSDVLAHQNLWIGRGYWDREHMYFKGAIDEIKIFDHALNQEEVSLLYLEGNTLSIDLQDGDTETETFLFPNPTNGIINLDIPGYIDRTLTFSIYSATGKLVYQLEISEINKSNTIDLSSLPGGIYLYTFKDVSGILNSDKLIIQ